MEEIMDPFYFLAISFLAAMLLASLALSMAHYVVAKFLEAIWDMFCLVLSSFCVWRD